MVIVVSLVVLEIRNRLLRCSLFSRKFVPVDLNECPLDFTFRKLEAKLKKNLK